MKSSSLCIAVLALTFTTGYAAYGAEKSPACPAITARIASALNVQIRLDGEGAGGASLPPKGSGARITVACAGRDERSVFVTFNYPAEYPNDLFYDQLAATGEILSGAAAARVRLQAHRCHLAARRAQGRAHKGKRFARIDCLRTARSSTFWMNGGQRAGAAKLP